MELQSVMRDENGLQGLRDLCNDIKNKIGKNNLSIVEIGSYMGESTEVFAQEFSYGKVYAIDPFEGGFDEKDSCSNADYKKVEEQFDLRTKKYDNIYKVKGYSTDYYIDCDVVYLDGRHFYQGVKEDILHWLPQTKYVICGHDFTTDEQVLEIHPHIKGVAEAVLEILGNPDKVFSDTSWIHYKTKK